MDSINSNFDFFIPLRNEIEHAFLPDLDEDIFVNVNHIFIILSIF